MTEAKKYHIQTFHVNSNSINEFGDYLKKKGLVIFSDTIFFPSNDRYYHSDQASVVTSIRGDGLIMRVAANEPQFIDDLVSSFPEGLVESLERYEGVERK
jgi:hypothetical protein